MASDEVTSQINTAVANVSTAAEQVAVPKGQLDNYGAFYNGLVDYTIAVSEAATGMGTLKINMDTLYRNTQTLKLSVGELNDAVSNLYSGTNDLAGGTSAFVGKTSDIDTQISDSMNSITSSITGNNDKTVSFISDKNTCVNSVQFVIKTTTVEKLETTATDTVEEAPLTFWKKLLRLFGLY